MIELNFTSHQDHKNNYFQDNYFLRFFNFSDDQTQFHSKFLGLVNYSDVEDWQRNHVQLFSKSKCVLVLAMQCRPVVTLGRRAVMTNEVKGTCDLSIHKTDRGGLATLHAPGQLVIFPMLDLAVFNLGVKDFVKIINEVSVEVLKHFKVTAHFDESKAGVYTNKGKIAYTGLKIDSGVSRHGIAINIFNDLGLFKQICSCGTGDQIHDKVENYFDKKRICFSHVSSISPVERNCAEENEIFFKQFFSLWNKCFLSKL